MGEKALIERIRRLAAAAASRSPSGRGRAEPGLRLRHGIGDDCAILRLPTGYQSHRGKPPSKAAIDLLLTTDFSLEDVHFRRAWHPAESVGHRCLARGLSDIAAMGGEPAAAFLSLALPPDLPRGWAEWFLRGLLTLARRHRVTLAGGDVAQSPAGVLADIVVVGSVPAGAALLRSAARPGHHVYVTGTLGRAAAVLHRLSRDPANKKRKKAARPGQRVNPSQAPHFFPQPRLAVGRRLRQAGLASACIDLSDGLSTDLAHICAESGVGAVVYQASLPLFTREADLEFSPARALELALHGGEDYELLFTAPPRARVPRRIAGVAVARIGEIVRGRKVWLQDENGKKRRLEPGGWEHAIG